MDAAPGAAKARRARADAQRNMDALLEGGEGGIRDFGRQRARAGNSRKRPSASARSIATFRSATISWRPSLRREIDACADAAPVLCGSIPAGRSAGAVAAALCRFHLGQARACGRAALGRPGVFEPLPAYFQQRLQAGAASLLAALRAAAAARCAPMSIPTNCWQRWPIFVPAGSQWRPWLCAQRMVALLVDGCCAMARTDLAPLQPRKHHQPFQSGSWPRARSSRASGHAPAVSRKSIPEDDIQ